MKTDRNNGIAKADVVELCHLYAANLGRSTVFARSQRDEITGRPANNDLPGLHVHGDDLALYLGNDPSRARGPIPHLLSCNSVIATL